MCALAFFCLVYLVFVLTLMPPVMAGNQDLLVYKAVRAALFAIVVLPILFFSDFAWCKRIPFFSSPHLSQRVLGVALLTVLLVCLSANLTYLHTPEYRAAATHRAALAFGVEEANVPAPKDGAGPREGSGSANAQEGSAADASADGDESLRNAWDERREGCGTDD